MRKDEVIYETTRFALQSLHKFQKEKNRVLSLDGCF